MNELANHRAVSDAAGAVGRQVRTAIFALVLFVAVTAAVVSWARVVDRLRSAEPLEVTGSASAIVWANRVFRSEAELAKWLRRHGVDYEDWVRRHPGAVAVLRSKGAPRNARDASRGN